MHAPDRQNGLELSTDKLDLALQAVAMLPPRDFHKVSRAAGSKRTDEMRGPVSCGMRYAPNDRRARGAIKKETGYEKD